MAMSGARGQNGESGGGGETRSQRRGKADLGSFRSGTITSPRRGGNETFLGSDRSRSQESVKGEGEGRRRQTQQGTLRSSKQGLMERKMEEARESGDVFLEGMALASIPSMVLMDASVVTKLYLNCNSLVVLPAEISRLSNLQDLCLEHNELVSLPKEIGQLKQLERLHCYGNQISTLPAELGLLVNLSRLFLGNNQIRHLPPEIGFLKNLEWLSLEDNCLEHLPPEIGNLSRLGWLSVECNQLKSLPKELGQLKALSFFSVVDNPMRTLPETLVQLENLKDLRTDVTFKIPKSIIDTRDGRTIIRYLNDSIARWDLDVDEKAHWVPDDECSKCTKCQKPFTTLKRRHHCRICGMIFCSKDCGLVCEIPGFRSQGRACGSCFAAVDPSNPTNVYMELRKQEEKKSAEKKYGLEAGEENLPVDVRRKKILEQVAEVEFEIQRGYKAQEGFNRLMTAFSSDVGQCMVTQQELDESKDRTRALERTKKGLQEIMRSLDAEEAKGK